MGRIIYDWATAQDVPDWRIEGNGAVLRGPDGQLIVRTYHCGPGRRATNIWLANVELPQRFRIRWRFRSGAPAGNAMCIFNARPVLLNHLFEDSRPDARYCDLASWRKMVTYTCGFHRGVCGNPCVLRKIGGQVPLEWGMLADETPAWSQCDQITRLATTVEPLTPADRGKWHDFLIERDADRIVFQVNGKTVHDVRDQGQYPYWREVLTGGKMGFRNFGGYAEDLYAQITVESLDD